MATAVTKFETQHDAFWFVGRVVLRQLWLQFPGNLRIELVAIDWPAIIKRETRKRLAGFGISDFHSEYRLS